MSNVCGDSVCDNRKLASDNGKSVDDNGKSANVNEQSVDTNRKLVNDYGKSVDDNRKSAEINEKITEIFDQHGFVNCPKCRRKIASSGGCTHFICSVCSNKFCFFCVKVLPKTLNAHNKKSKRNPKPCPLHLKTHPLLPNEYSEFYFYRTLRNLRELSRKYSPEDWNRALERNNTLTTISISSPFLREPFNKPPYLKPEFSNIAKKETITLVDALRTDFPNCNDFAEPLP